MRIIHSLCFLLLAGILSPSTADESDLSQKGLILSILEMSMNPESIYQTPEEQSDAVYKLLKKSCDKNGGKSAYKIAKESWEHYNNCNASANQMKSNVTVHHVQGDAVNAVKDVCAHVPSMKECIKRLKDSVEPCLEPEEHQIAKLMFDVLNAVLQFTCDIDGEPIEKFVADDGMECFRSNRVMLLSCYIEIPSVRHLADSSEELLPVGIQGLVNLLPTAKNCSDIEKLETCSVRVLKKCAKPTAAEMADLFINKMKDAMDCKNLLKNTAESISVTNGILITAVMAIFHVFNINLRF